MLAKEVMSLNKEENLQDIILFFLQEIIEIIENRIFDLAFDFQMKYLIDISVVIKNEEQFNYWLGVMLFYDNVQREGIVLGG